LRRLQAAGLPPDSGTEAFYTSLGDIVRRYLTDRFGLRAFKKTTEELLDLAATLQGLNAPQRESLRQFLQSCDLAKFARLENTAVQRQASAAWLGDFVRQTSAPPPYV
jgi:hypothetical protein